MVSLVLVLVAVAALAIANKLMDRNATREWEAKLEWLNREAGNDRQR